MYSGLARGEMRHSVSLMTFFFFICKKLYIFLRYFWLRWVFVAARGLSLVAASGGFSLQWLLFVAEHGL